MKWVICSKTIFGRFVGFVLNLEYFDNVQGRDPVELTELVVLFL